MNSLTRATAFGPAHFLSVPFELVASVWIDLKEIARAGATRARDESTRTLTVPGDVAGGDSLSRTLHVWWSPPNSWREDISHDTEHVDVIVVRGDCAMTFLAAQQELFTNRPADFPSCPHSASSSGHLFSRFLEIPTVISRMQGFPLLFPPFPTDAWSLTRLAAQPSDFGASAVLRVLRRRPPRPEGEDAQSGFWFGVDEYEVVIDTRTGIIVRFTGFAGSAVVGSIQVTRLSLDVRSEDDPFTFLPPPRTRIVAVGA